MAGGFSSENPMLRVLRALRATAYPRHLWAWPIYFTVLEFSLLSRLLRMFSRLTVLIFRIRVSTGKREPHVTLNLFRFYELFFYLFYFVFLFASYL